MDKVMDAIISQGIWTLLSFFLIYYILKAQEKRDIQQDLREKKYQEIISNLSEKFKLIHSDIKDIKKNIEIFKK